jgi:hypothetical protein
MLYVIYMLVINLITFYLYGRDKRKAEKSEWRIPEATLLAFVILGGAFGGLLGMKIYHHKTKKNKFRITVPIFAIWYVIFCVFSLYQNYHLVVTEYDYKSSKVSAELSGYTIVQISDLHNQIFGIGQKSLLKKIREQSPDMIVVTGDVVDLTHTFFKPAEDFFEGAVEIAPVYYVTGNHESWIAQSKSKGERYREFISNIERMGVHYIDDQCVSLDGFTLIGVSDMNLPEKVPHGDSPSGVLNILLAHEPKMIDGYREAGMDLVFTGHVHGGQIIIPGVGGVFDPDFRFFPDPYEGMLEYGDTTMVLSRGLGNSVLPIRINNYPEIVVIELQAR